MTHHIIQHAYEQLRQRLMLNTWKDVPKVLVCYCLHSMFHAADIMDMIGTYEVDDELVSKYYWELSETIDTMNVKVTYEIR
jgi:hypothetical protein